MVVVGLQQARWLGMMKVGRVAMVMEGVERLSVVGVVSYGLL